MSIDVSVILATYRRPESLAETLESLTHLRVGNIEHEIIVVDNDDGEEVAALVRSFANRLPVRFLVEPAQGKNRALMKGLGHAAGELLVFTDDDVIVSADWLTELVAGASRNPEASFFGGRILPRFPPGFQEWLASLDFDHWFTRSAYVVADWDYADGERIDPREVWGPNMAVRRRVFEAGISFDPTIGPQGGDYVMGSETEFLLRVQAAGFDGVYLPRAVVHHIIRPEQMSTEWLLGRAYRMGRGHAVRRAASTAPRILGVPRYLFRQYLELQLERLLSGRRPPADRRKTLIGLALVRGEIRQYLTAARS